MRKRIDNREKAIMQAALEIIKDRDFEKTPILEITDRAGVAKGTFYLYFQDKFELRDSLIAYSYADFFIDAALEIRAKNILDLEDRILYTLNYIIEQLKADVALQHLLPMNLNWKTFKAALIKRGEERGMNIMDMYYKVLDDSPYKFKNSNYLFFMLIQFSNSICFNAIVNEMPATIDELKPDLFETILSILEARKIK